MATSIPDEGLFAFSERARGQVVLITGAANGIGKAVAIDFAKRGSKLVIGDVDLKGGADLVAEIRNLGGEAVFQRCNVLDYNDQVSLFQAGKASFGDIDVVIPNAGVGESDRLMTVSLDEKGVPRKPNVKTLEINLIAAAYTAQLASYYLSQNKKEGSLKALVFVGSMASFSRLTIAPMYTATKHAILGLMRCAAFELEPNGIRVAAACPWFVDTTILPFAMKAILAGIPMVPLSRISAAIFLAATDGTEGTNGAAYTLPDDREVYRIPLNELTEGVYGMLNKRAERIRSSVQGLKTFFVFLSLCMRSPSFKVFVISVLAYIAALIFGLI